jgi:hypothetical protein
MYSFGVYFVAPNSSKFWPQCRGHFCWAFRHLTAVQNAIGVKTRNASDFKHGSTSQTDLIILQHAATNNDLLRLMWGLAYAMIHKWRGLLRYAQKLYCSIHLLYNPYWYSDGECWHNYTRNVFCKIAYINMSYPGSWSGWTLPSNNRFCLQRNAVGQSHMCTVFAQEGWRTRRKLDVRYTFGLSIVYYRKALTKFIIMEQSLPPGFWDT